MKIPKRFWILLDVAVVSALAYSSTIMFSFNGGDSPYTDDTGEFQLALTLWGVPHHTGYPLYMLLGSPFVNLLRLFGIPPALGSSLFSMMWTLIAVVGVAMIVWRLTQRHEDTKSQSLFIVHSSLFIALVFALTRSIRIHASIAEVYALNMAFEVAIIWLTLDLMEKWDDKKGWLLALVGGLGVAHHRLVAMGLPVVGLMLLPMALGSKGNKGNGGKSSLISLSSLVSFAKWFAISIPFFLLGFLPYLDIMRRIASGATWVYGKTDSWQGLWNLFTASEVSDWQKPVFDLATIAQNFVDIINVLGNELTWFGFAAATLGTLIAIIAPRTRKPALLFSSIALSYVVFTALVRKAVMIEANLMFVSLALLLGATLGLNQILNREDAKGAKILNIPLRVLRAFAVFALLVWATTLFVVHRDSVLALTRNPQSIDYVSQIEKIEAPANSYIMAPWGWRYFGLSYANLIEGRLKGFTIIDHNADYGALASKTDSIYTYYDTF
ncbi:DUF2723 domain-containing protein, partial [Candidatus Woesearchaeota archaeon]|nr:DUF2723 domain-containing protein [Candidatus Woesearchaeota archaeon]